MSPFCVCVCSYFNYFLVLSFFFFFRCLEYFSRVGIVHPLLVWGLLQLYNNGSYFYRLLPLSPGVLPVWSFFFLSYLPLHSLVIVFLSFFFLFYSTWFPSSSSGHFYFRRGRLAALSTNFVFVDARHERKDETRESKTAVGYSEDLSRVTKP